MGEELVEDGDDHEDQDEDDSSSNEHLKSIVNPTLCCWQASTEDVAILPFGAGPRHEGDSMSGRSR